MNMSQTNAEEANRQANADEAPRPQAQTNATAAPDPHDQSAIDAAPGPQAQTEAADDSATDHVELSMDDLEQISGGDRIVGGVRKYGKREKELLICPNSPLPHRAHKWINVGTTTQDYVLFSKEYNVLECKYCQMRVRDEI
jgi:hypothetical protein